MLIVPSLLLSLRMDGLKATARRAWVLLFGQEEWYVFVRHLEPPSTPLEFPVETKGITVRAMTPRDLEAVARLIPFDLDRGSLRERRERMQSRLSEAMVATRGDHIVGAVCFIDAVTAEQPWYRAVEPYLIPPTRFTAQLFVVPGEKGTAWVLAKHANDRLAALGVRTVVGLIKTDNKPSILVSRLLGGKMVARKSDRFWFGRRTTMVESVRDEYPFTGDRSSPPSPLHP